MSLLYKQSSFLGGMTQLFDATKVAQMGDSYYLGINVRNREDILEPVRSPKNISDKIPTGKLQGLYAAGTILLLFIDGIAYIRNVADVNTGFIKVQFFQLDKNVDYIYVAFVPGSTIGYVRVRQPNTLTGQQDNITYDFNSLVPFSSSQQGVICQDGINQGLLIKDDGTVTRLQTYAEWTLEKREYVPVMKQMLFYNAILFGFSPDGKQIYRSVSGRPLDFVIPVDDDGNKLANENEGGASALAHRVDFEVMTCITATPSPDTLAVGTINRTFIISLNYDDTRFSEPSFSNFPIFTVGPFNQFSFADINGDTAFIHSSGIGSFNAASILKRESNNEPFSGMISRLFKKIGDNSNQKVMQTFPCTSETDDYTFFAVNTVYGAGVLVFDKISQKFVSLDLYSGVAQIKQFAEVKVGGERKLFFITVDNKLYEAFAGAIVETAGILIGEWCSNDPKIEQKPQYVRLVFTECEEDGNVFITPLVDRKAGDRRRESLNKRIEPKTIPLKIPFGEDKKDSVQNITFNIGIIGSGWKFGCLIEWDVKAKLSHISVDTESQTSVVSQETRAKKYVEGIK